MKNNLEKKLQAIKVQPLSSEECDQVWQQVQARLQEPVLVRHNFLSLLIHKPMIQIALIIMLLFGGSAATVAAADSAKPGDLLFPLDRAVENVRIKLASAEKKDELKIDFAKERAKEVEEIIAESASSVGVATSTVSTTPATSTVVELDKDSQKKVEQSLNVALEYITTVKQELANKGNARAVATLDEIIDRINASIGELPAKVRVEAEKEKDKYKVELKTEKSKAEIKLETDGDKSEYESEGEDGKTKIKVEDDGKIKVESGDSDHDQDQQDENHDSSKGLTEAEAKISGGQAVIKVEFNNQHRSLVTDSTDEAGIVDAVVQELGVSQEEVGQVLKIESGDSDYSDDNNDNPDANASALKEAEAKTEAGIIKVKVKFSSGEDNFTLGATDRAGVIDYIADKYSLDRAEVDAVLKFEQ